MKTTVSENDKGEATIADNPIPQSPLATSGAEAEAENVPKMTLQPQATPEDAPNATKVPDDAFCWICHEDGTKNGQEIRLGFKSSSETVPVGALQDSLIGLALLSMQ